MKVIIRPEKTLQKPAAEKARAAGNEEALPAQIFPQIYRAGENIIQIISKGIVALRYSTQKNLLGEHLRASNGQPLIVDLSHHVLVNELAILHDQASVNVFPKMLVVHTSIQDIARHGVTVTELPKKKRSPVRRWVVERTLFWQNDFRSLRIRWSKNPDSWLAFIHFASTLVLWQMATKL